MRLLTALAIIGLCAFAAIRGWSMAHFAEERARFASSQSEVAGVGRWIGVPGLTGAALETSLAQTVGASDIDGVRKRAESLAALLSVRPLSSENWLSFAGMRLVTARPYNEVLAALLMSSVTGPNEGTVMWQRGIFGLLLWQALPSDARRRTIGDLAGAIGGGSVGDREMRAAKNVLGVKSMETRSAIADLLRAEGVTEVKLDRMGL
jgi:hypothetical protein